MNLQDRADIIDLCTRMMWSVDTHDWETFETVFAPKVTLDFTSFWDGEPDVVTPPDVTKAWAALFAEFEATQHLLGNHLVETDGDRGTLTAAFHSTHRRSDPYGDPLWTIGGNYRFEVLRIDGTWKIEKVVMTATWGQGNTDVVKAARGAQ
ncbi:nuclear transport factor 2 family protein [Streptomyces xantholiticus]